MAEEMVAPTNEGRLNENRRQTDDLDRNWVASMREKLRVEPGRIKAWSAKNTCSIHRVPKILRQHDEEAYEPQLISIGPFHHDKRSTNLAAMEEHKWRYLNAILTKNIENDGFERCLSALKELEQKARECYSEEIRLDSNSFVEMMVIDGCFLIEFFRRLFFASEGHKDDPLLNLGWIRHRLFFDLLLLENQIPFLILKPLLNLMNMSFGVFLGMAITFCFTELSSMNKNYKLTKFSRLFQNQTHHLLHLLHFIVLPQIRDEREVRGNTLEMIPCASQLKEAGIKFKKSDACSFLDIEFQNGLLEIPPLQIGDGVNCLFRNLIAFEQCYPHCNSHFTTYVTFMDFIINSAKDVEILNRSGIIDNWLGSDEDIAGEGTAPSTVAETAWNMRAASRAEGSLLRFMKEEIAGVTSPMVYVAMMFSWFAWHVEDHDLHSLNYLHLGAAKTWYGVPRDAAVAFEEVVRMHGYGGEVNPVVTFAILGEKTTVMSPEVLVEAGIPCCRLVQNAGEFVVTFPRAYHSGFSHGFNCGEAANIATPEWLRVAKEAAIRRASINYPPMVSHFQLLYALALTLYSRVPMRIRNEPRSSRLKDKKRGEGETIVKDLFVQSVIQNNELLHILLEKGSSCVLLPQDSSDLSLCPNSRFGSQIKVKPRALLGLCSPEEAMEASGSLLCEDAVLDWNLQLGHSNGVCQRKKIPSVKYGNFSRDYLYASTSDSQSMDNGKEATSRSDGLLDQGLFPCVTCGILSFACVAVIQPRESASKNLMSTDCKLFDNDLVGVTSDYSYDVSTNNSHLDTFSGRMEKDGHGGLHDIFIQSADCKVLVKHQRVEQAHSTRVQGISSLDLLAHAYGDSSDSEEEVIRHPRMPVCSDEHDLTGYLSGQEHQDKAVRVLSDPLSALGTGDASNQICTLKERGPRTLECLVGNAKKHLVSEERWGLDSANRNRIITPGSRISSREVANSVEGDIKESDGSCSTRIDASKAHQGDVKVGDPEFDSADVSLPSTDVHLISYGAATGKYVETRFNDIDTSVKNSNISFIQTTDRDPFRMHIFCLEHAVEVEKLLRPLGGVHMLLLCHPEYPKVEGQAKLVAEELGIDYLWKGIHFREATNDDKEKIRSALDDEQIVPGPGDWAVKLGINLYFSANLSKSPLYSKQMPYNAVLYKAFGRRSPVDSPTKPKVSLRKPGRQKKIVVAGKWCGRVWMTSQVHPYLANRDSEEQESESIPLNRDTDHEPETPVTDINLVEKRMLPKEKSLPTTIPRKSGRKRRKLFEDAVSKKAKSPEADDTPISVENSPENPSSRCQRVLRSRVKHEDAASNDSNFNEENGGSSMCLRRRTSKLKEVKTKAKEVRPKPAVERHLRKRKVKKAPSNNDVAVKDEEAEYQCNVDGCTMGFCTKQELMLHKRNICSVKGCGKKLFSHKYLMQHRRVHMDDRPLKCPWKGCKMTFKWAWARTEHIRVHTGVRPYMCREPGCGQTFRFVSDFSRHKRKTGHSVKKGRG